jgi:hypothetical protein
MEWANNNELATTTAKDHCMKLTQTGPSPPTNHFFLPPRSRMPSVSTTSGPTL